MPESPSSSFIPKRGPGKKPSSARPGNFVLFSVLSYALFVSAPLASAAVFIYERHTENQFNKAVVALDQAIISFNEEDLRRVTEFNERLATSKLLLESHASIVSLLQTIENSTAQTVKFKSIDITRASKSTLTVNGFLTTPSFDGALFQRSSYGATDIINNPLFTDVKLMKVTAEDPAATVSEEKNVELKVSFDFAVSDVLYKPFVGETTFDQSINASDETAFPTEDISTSANETTL
ncbi:MAG: hypothetical protein V4606_00430 [Patescibacteria group bacterium]